MAGIAMPGRMTRKPAPMFVEQNGALFNLYLQWKVSECSWSDVRSHIIQDAARHRFASLMTDLLGRAAQAGRIRRDIPGARLVWVLLAMLEVPLLDWWRQPTRFSCKSHGEQIVGWTRAHAVRRRRKCQAGGSASRRHRNLVRRRGPLAEVVNHQDGRGSLVREVEAVGREDAANRFRLRRNDLRELNRHGWASFPCCAL